MLTHRTFLTEQCATASCSQCIPESSGSHACGYLFTMSVETVCMSSLVFQSQTGEECGKGDSACLETKAPTFCEKGHCCYPNSAHLARILVSGPVSYRLDGRHRSSKLRKTNPCGPATPAASVCSKSDLLCDPRLHASEEKGSPSRRGQNPGQYACSFASCNRSTTGPHPKPLSFFTSPLLGGRSQRNEFRLNGMLLPWSRSNPSEG